MDRHLIGGEVVIDEQTEPGSTASSSIKAEPTPIVIAPITWLRRLGLMIRPAAHTASIRRSRVAPV